MKTVDMTFWIAVAALCVAVWAAARVVSVSKASTKRDAYVLDRVVELKRHSNDRMITIEGRVEEMEVRIDNLEERMDQADAVLDEHNGYLCEHEDDPEERVREVGVIRTTSGKRPDVRNVTDGED